MTWDKSMYSLNAFLYIYFMNLDTQNQFCSAVFISLMSSHICFFLTLEISKYSRQQMLNMILGKIRLYFICESSASRWLTWSIKYCFWFFKAGTDIENVVCCKFLVEIWKYLYCICLDVPIAIHIILILTGWLWKSFPLLVANVLAYW